MNDHVQFRANAKLDAVALFVACLNRDEEGWQVLLSSLETRADALRAVAGLASLCTSLATMAFEDPHDLAQQWAAMVARELQLPSPDASERPFRGLDE
jgi:hypothetical protein